MSKYKLNGLTAVVTGASSGIGRAVAEKLIARYGCTVVGVGRDENKFRDFSEKLGENVSRFSYRLFDVGNREEWKEFCTFLTKSGIRPDLLVNCAGILPSFSFYGENSDAELAVKTNFLSVVYSLGAALKRERKAQDCQRRKLVFAVSVCGRCRLLRLESGDRTLYRVRRAGKGDSRSDRYARIYRYGRISLSKFRCEKQNVFSKIQHDCRSHVR